MKKIIIALFSVFLLVGCGASGEKNIDVKKLLVVKQSLNSLALNDQNGKSHSINTDTTKVIFAFSKDVGHNCNEFFATKDASYLEDNKAQFVADISAAPSLVRSMFIMPGLKDFKHTVLIIDDENISASYKLDVNNEKIVVVDVLNKTISDIKYFNSAEELDKYITK
jgi:hypothetical protein